LHSCYYHYYYYYTRDTYHARARQCCT
jgi:hypothetical protein